MAASAHDRAPVLAGIGTCSQRVDTLAAAREPLDLMIEAARRALADAGARSADIARVLVPKGRWRYRNPGGEIARALGAPQATTVLAEVGVLQQTLIADACSRIAAGEIEAALVVGGDTGHRIRVAQRAGVRASERQQDDAPHEHWQPEQELLHPAELAAGIRMPVPLYAVIESALRASIGATPQEHRNALGELMADFSRVAAANPDAWRREALDAQAIAQASPRNALQTDPYCRLHCADWNVDQAGALLLCSAQRARAWGLDSERWVYARASAESNFMQPLSAREHIASAPGAPQAVRALEHASGIRCGDVELLDLYSCFPAAVQLHAQAIGAAAHDPRPLTVTGGLPFAGGPFNNYVLQATCRIAALLRERRGRHGLVSSVSGVLTKPAFGLWSTEPGPFAACDVSAEVAQAAGIRPVLMEYDGPARIVGLTVLPQDQVETLRALVLAETPAGERVWAHSSAPEWIASVQREEWVGRKVRIQSHQLQPS
jgi:acetyl-CoA C-acetyltransferase